MFPIQKEMADSLSVDSRVKAHISTMYICADGRGPRNIDGSLRSRNSRPPACLLSPAEFHAMQLQTINERAGSTSDSLLGQSERNLADVESRLRALDQSRALALKELHRGDGATVAPRMQSILDERREGRKAAKEADRAALAHSYIHRNDGPEAWKSYLENSKPSDAAKLRELEDEVHARRKALTDLARISTGAQVLAIENRKNLADHEHRVKTQLEVVARQQESLDERATRQRQSEAELRQLNDQRAQEMILRREMDRSNAELDGKLAIWESRAVTAVLKQREFHEVRLQKEKIVAHLLERSKQAQVAEDLRAVLSLAAELEAEANTLRALVEAAKNDVPVENVE